MPTFVKRRKSRKHRKRTASEFYSISFNDEQRSDFKAKSLNRDKKRLKLWKTSPYQAISHVIRNSKFPLIGVFLFAILTLSNFFEIGTCDLLWRHDAWSKVFQVRIGRESQIEIGKICNPVIHRILSLIPCDFAWKMTKILTNGYIDNAIENILLFEKRRLCKYIKKIQIDIEMEIDENAQFLIYEFIHGNVSFDNKKILGLFDSPHSWHRDDWRLFCHIVGINEPLRGAFCGKWSCIQGSTYSLIRTISQDFDKDINKIINYRSTKQMPSWQKAIDQSKSNETISMITILNQFKPRIVTQNEINLAKHFYAYMYNQTSGYH